MGGGGGLTQSGPTAEERQQTALQNQLLQQQLAEAARVRAEQEYKNSAEYKNIELAKTRASQQKEFDTSKNAAYKTAKQNIIDQFTAFGDPNAAKPYLDALDAQYNSLQYKQGGNYTSVANEGAGPRPVEGNTFDEAAYLRANPDVAAAVQNGYFANGAQHYAMIGKQEGRQMLSDTPATRTVAPTADTWDDPTKLTNSDYGAGTYIADQRKARKDTAYNTAVGNAQTMLKGMGLDQGTYDQLWGLTDTQFKNKYNSAGLSSNDYTNAFDAQAVLDSVLGTGRTARRTQYTTAVNSKFGGIDPNSDFADTADDQYITDLVGKQYGDATSALERAYKRGALTDLGYKSGSSYLGDQQKSALSSAQSLGGAVLQKNRDALGGIVSGAKTAASGWDFGQSFDADKYLNDYSTKKGSLMGSLEGDITNALAGQNWFDVGDVLTKAGYAQGAQNTAALTEGYTTPGAAGLAGLREKDKNAQRGLGGVGVF